ncbi:MAG TPA: SDR family oxidoreductase [Paenalcaligenes sp.]|nr:SDR family oxidoreductase [Paenalcaligenes sp.]
MTKKIALVTGAGSGIGRATALALADAGYTVVLTGRTQASLVETQELSPAGMCVVHRCDVSQPIQVKNLFDFIKEEYGRLDLLFNNAGIGHAEVDIDALAIEDWQQIVNINLNGSFYCAREAFKLMKEQQPQGGRIINNGSISAYAPRPHSVGYTTTKHAISGLTKSLSLDGRPYDIVCSQIDVGNAATQITKDSASGRLQPDGQIRPEPTMDVAEVAQAVVYMAEQPLTVNVQFMTIMATKMPYIGRG